MKSPPIPKAAGIVAGMVSLVPNYPSSGARYTPAELAYFGRLASLAQLAEHQPDFVASFPGGVEMIDVDAFPSLKAMSHTVFHKFYADKARKPLHSDAFDVLIAAALPYVEAVITEAHVANALGKMKQRDFLAHLEAFTLRDFARSHVWQDPTKEHEKNSQPEDHRREVRARCERDEARERGSEPCSTGDAEPVALSPRVGRSVPTCRRSASRTGGPGGSPSLSHARLDFVVESAREPTVQAV